MNPSQHAEQFQSQLANYVPQFTPEFLPVWLIIAGVLLVGMWLVPVIAIDHAFKGFVWRTPRGAKIKMTEDKKEAYKCQSKMRLQ